MSSAGSASASSPSATVVTLSASPRPLLPHCSGRTRGGAGRAAGAWAGAGPFEGWRVGKCVRLRVHKACREPPERPIAQLWNFWVVQLAMTVAHKKKWAPRSIVFSSRFAKARVSLSCKRALPCPGRRCVCEKASLVSAGAPRHDSALPAWRITPGLFRVARCLCFWRAIGQSAQAEQDTLILCSSQVRHTNH